MTTPEAGEDEKKLDYSCTDGWNIKWYSHSGKGWKFLQKLNIQLPSDPAPAFSGFIPGKWRLCSCKNLYASVYSSLIHHSQKVETTQVSSNRWKDKHSVGRSCHGTLHSQKQEWTWSMVTTWVGLQRILLNDKSNSKSLKYCMILFM